MKFISVYPNPADMFICGLWLS